MKNLVSILSVLNINLSERMIQEALTHSSCKFDNLGIKDNKQLETLGDSVIDLIVIEKIITLQPEIKSGKLTKEKSRLVNNHTLSVIGFELGIHHYLKISDKYEVVDNDIANCFEAIIGAIYRIFGLQKCKDFIHSIWSDIELIAENKLIKLSEASVVSNPIGFLQEFTQKHGIPLPNYDLISTGGTSHRPIFGICAKLKFDSKIIEANGEGKTKQFARAKAATNIIKELKRNNYL